MRVLPAPGSCRVVAAPIPVGWVAPDSPRDASALSAWCAAVGPPVVRVGSNRPPGITTLGVVSWNLHEDAGDLAAFVHALVRGELSPRAEPVDGFILLLQEAVRSSPELPRLTRGMRAAGSIVSGAGSRADIVATAAALNLSLVYVPSMRNGAASDEDRGNAIVSTLPPSSVTAIELPFEHQRRVAVLAAFDAIGPLPSLRAVSTHFDTVSSLTRGGPVAGRERQARALDAVLSDVDVPSIVGGDFNTWFGRGEPAYAVFESRFADPLRASPATWIGPAMLRAHLDHVFVRLPPSVGVSAWRASSRFGSDHYPLVLLIRF